MKLVLVPLALIPMLAFAACRSSHPQENAARAAAAEEGMQMEIIVFQHQDASSAANHARAEFGRPPMEGEVQVLCDAVRNCWVVKASASDMQRVKAIAARYDKAEAKK